MIPIIFGSLAFQLENPNRWKIFTKIRLTMLCLSGFELYSRWVPLLIHNDKSFENRCSKTEILSCEKVPISWEFRRRLYVSGERSSFIALSLKMETHFTLNIGNQLKKEAKLKLRRLRTCFTILFCPDINVKNYPENVYYVTHRKLFG